MVERVNIEFFHSTYDTYKHVQGKPPLVDEDAEATINSFLRGAKNAVDQSEGRFFETFETVEGKQDMFTFGFLMKSKRRGGSERFFDLYATPVKNVELLSLESISKSLTEQNSHITQRNQVIDEKVEALCETVEPYTGDISSINGGNKPEHKFTNRSSAKGLLDKTTEKDCCEPSSNQGTENRATSQENKEFFEQEAIDGLVNSNTTPSSEKVSTEAKMLADWWEHWRCTNIPFRASLSELTVFTQIVDGALPRFRYVSAVRGEQSYFNVIGTSREQSLDYGDLAKRLDEQLTTGRLDWEDLPTYKNELNSLWRTQRSALEASAEYDSRIEDVLTEFETVLKDNIVDSHIKSALQLYDEGVIGDKTSNVDKTNRETERTFRSGLGWAIGNSESKEEDDEFAELFANIETEYTDCETKKIIARKLTREVSEELCELVVRHVEEQLADSLREIVNKESERLVRETINNIEEVKSSRAYKGFQGVKEESNLERD
jgi:hypothetical protein